MLDAVAAALSPEARELVEKQIAGTRRIQRLFNTLEQYPSRGQTPTHDPAIALQNRSDELKLATVQVRGSTATGRVTVTAVKGHVFSLAWRPNANALGDPDSIVATSVTIHADPMRPDDGTGAELRFAGLDPALRADLEQAWADERPSISGLLDPDRTYEVELDDGTWLMLAELDDTTFLLARSDPSAPGLRRLHPSGDLVADYPSLADALSDLPAKSDH